MVRRPTVPLVTASSPMCGAEPSARRGRTARGRPITICCTADPSAKIRMWRADRGDPLATHHH
jgi:hypothetical protein